jgi:chemotaxis protein MotB
VSRRKIPERKQVSHEWLTTYSTIMTILLVFFVVLYNKEFSHVSFTQSPNDKNTILSQNITGFEETETVYKQVSAYIEKNKLDEMVGVSKEDRGVVIDIQDSILFTSNESGLNQESYPLLETISVLLNKFPNEVIVEGHTDNLPINTGYYQSNWELSTDRANKVVRYFVEKDGMDGRRFQAAGCGEFRPKDTNSTPEGRQKNRRVNILIVTSNKK